MTDSPVKFNNIPRKFYKSMPTLRFIVLLESILLLGSANGHREHKVHNITLYPDKHSWCNVLPIKQVISHPGCKSVEIDNNVCVGACFSYSIPHTEPSDPGEVIVPYCDSCQPSEKKLIHINLECDANESDKKSQQLKVVQYITNCTCTSCEKDKYLEQILLGNSAKEIKELQNDAPDLLDALQNRDEINPKFFNLDPERSKLLKNLMNSQIMTLLKNIQSENSQKDKEQLTEALKIINEQSKEKVSDSTIAALVNSFYRENIELDLPKLLETLQALDNSKYFEKLRKNNNNNHEGSGSEQNYNNNNNDDDDNIDDGISLSEGSHVGMGHLKGAHIGMGFNHYSHHHHHQQQQQHKKQQHPHELNYDTDHNSSSNEDYDDRNDNNYNEQHHHNDIEVENIPNKLDLNENSLLHKVHHKIHTHHMHHKHHHGNTGSGSTGTIHHGSDSALLSGSSNIGGSTGTDSGAANEIDKPSLSSSNGGTGGLNKDESHIQVHPKHHHHLHHHHQQHGHHHLGEQIGHGHLTHGPHGSLVIEPDHIEHLDSQQNSNGHERINVNPNDLKPNNAGTLLSYSSHPTSSNNS